LAWCGSSGFPRHGNRPESHGMRRPMGVGMPPADAPEQWRAQWKPEEARMSGFFCRI